MSAPVRLRLPATSANLGPGFDAIALAMGFALHVEAKASDRDRIAAAGRSPAQISDVADSLILSTYRIILSEQGIDAPPIALSLRNDIPLGMGCGSSAAALIAGVALASHFGRLGWSPLKVLTEASLREGHPDNVAACVLGGFTVSAHGSGSGPATIPALSITPASDWPLLLVLPESSLSTSKARALLPEVYTKADAISNVQRSALLTAAFTLGRGDLLAEAMRDTMHQPYRQRACPLLPLLLPMAGQADVLGVALSGAGPSVLMILREGADMELVRHTVRERLGSAPAELLETRIAGPALLAL